jgi:hypothetical protein
VFLGLIKALESRFPAVRAVVGEAFFREAARDFARQNPPRSPVMMFYGDEFPDFLDHFAEASDLPYLSGVARIEAARTGAYHAAFAAALPAAAFASIPPYALPGLKVRLHPSLSIVRSQYPIVTIWAMNAGEAELAPIGDWTGEDALIVRPRMEVIVRALPAGGAAFLLSLAAGTAFAKAAAMTVREQPGFDLTANLANIIAGGLVVKLDQDPSSGEACEL